jgi:hypothetical protein
MQSRERRESWRGRNRRALQSCPRRERLREQVSEEQSKHTHSLPTILWFQVPVQNHVGHLLALQLGRLRIRAQAHDVTSDLWRVLAVMATVQCADQLRKNAPDELFFGVLILLLQPFDHLAQIAVAAILHVEMQVLRGSEMVPLVVLHDVWVTKLAEDG